MNDAELFPRFDDSFKELNAFLVRLVKEEEHQALLANFHRMLKPGGLALLCLGAEHLVDDIDENYLGTRMYRSHYDAQTYLQMLKNCGFEILWSGHVTDESCEGAGHLFVLGQK